MVKPPPPKPEKKKPEPAPPPPPPQVQQVEPEEPVDQAIPHGHRQAKDQEGRLLYRYSVRHVVEPAVISEPVQEVVAINPEEAANVYMANTGMHSTPFIFEVSTLGPALDKIGGEITPAKDEPQSKQGKKG